MKHSEQNPFYKLTHSKTGKIIAAAVIIDRVIPIAIRDDENNIDEFKKRVASIDRLIIGKIGRLKHVKKRCLKRFAWNALEEIITQCRERNLIVYLDREFVLSGSVSQAMLARKHITGLTIPKGKTDSEAKQVWFIDLVRSTFRRWCTEPTKSIEATIQKGDIEK